MGTSRAMRIFLLTGGSLLALLLSSLGLETCADNLLGWLLVFIGIGYITGGAIYLWAYHDKDMPAREETSDRSFWLILPGFLAVFYAPPLEYLYLPEVLPRGVGMQVLGLFLICAGVLLRVWTRMTLKEMYTGHVQVKEGHRLVREGPYHFVRHPGYLGYLLMAVGLSIGFSSLLGLAAILVLMLPGLAYRMRVEEKLLTDEFGDEYRQYSRGTKRLFPGIW